MPKFQAGGLGFKVCMMGFVSYVSIPVVTHARTTDPGLFPPPPAAAAAAAAVTDAPTDDVPLRRRSCRARARSSIATSSFSRALSAPSCSSAARCRRRMAWASSLYTCRDQGGAIDVSAEYRGFVLDQSAVDEITGSN